MKISTVRQKVRQEQRLLFDIPLGNHGVIRTHIGKLAEQLIASLLGGDVHQTDARCDYCPDVSREISGERVYFECKSAGLSQQTFIYSGRLEKDREFAIEHTLFYCVVSHSAETKRAQTVQQLQALFFASLKSLYLVPFSEIDLIAQSKKVDKLNSNYGGTDRKTYGSGIRIPLGDLEAFKLIDFEEC